MLTGAFYAGNFREWSQSSLVMSSSQQPPATHPATLRKTHQDLPSMAEELAMTSLVCCKASTARCFGIFSGPGGAGGWDGWHVKHRRLQGFKTLRWFKHLKSLHTGDMIYIYINWYDGCSTEPLWHALTMNSSTSHECSSPASWKHNPIWRDRTRPKPLGEPVPSPSSPTSTFGAWASKSLMFGDCQSSTLQVDIRSAKSSTPLGSTGFLISLPILCSW